MSGVQGLSFNVAGFPVAVQPGAGLLAGVLFLLFLGWGWSFPLILGTLFVAFASILFHELGHAVAARMYALRPIRITVHGFGGTTFHQPARSAWSNLVIVLAGPGAGFLLAFTGLLAWLAAPSGLLGDIAFQVLALNLVWSVFNLVPILPLDGGNALLSGLLLFLAPDRAYPITWGIGLAMAVLLGLYAFARGELFMLFFAGMFAWRNLQTLQAWRSGALRRGV